MTEKNSKFVNELLADEGVKEQLQKANTHFLNKSEHEYLSEEEFAELLSTLEA